MAQQRLQRNSAGSAFLWGSVFGAGAIAITLIGRFILAGRIARALRIGIRPVAGVTLAGVLLSLAVIACYVLAGLLAARRAGRIDAGIFAGLIAGGIVGLGTLALTLIGLGLARRGLHMGVGLRGGVARPRLVMPVLMPALVRMLSSAIVGTGLGALGALVGRPRGNTAGIGGSYAYQAGATTHGAGSVPGVPGHGHVPGYAAPTPPPPGYPTGDDTPTVQSDSTPPMV